MYAKGYEDGWFWRPKISDNAEYLRGYRRGCLEVRYELVHYLEYRFGYYYAD